MVKNVKRYMKQQKKDILPCLVADFVPVTYILPQVSCYLNLIRNVHVHFRHNERNIMWIVVHVGCSFSHVLLA